MTSRAHNLISSLVADIVVKLTHSLCKVSTIMSKTPRYAMRCQVANTCSLAIVIGILNGDSTSRYILIIHRPCDRGARRLGIRPFCYVAEAPTRF